MSKGRARIAVGQGVSLWLLEARDGFGDAGLHAHHAIQLTYCLNGELMLATEQESLTCHAIGVAADAMHRLQARGMLALIFVEPESAAGRTLTAKLFAQGALSSIEHCGFKSIMAGFRDSLDREDSTEELLAAARHAIDQLAPITCTHRPDERVQRIIDFTAAHLDQPLTLKTASQSVYLSNDRLRHLFVEQTGLPFRAYVLWLRLVRAVSQYATGATLTEAAHAAGFSDSAHFSRVFKRTFGLPATTLTRL